MEDRQVALLCGSFLLAGALAILGLWVVGGRRRRAAALLNKDVTDAVEKKQSEQREVNQQPIAGGGVSKRQAKSKKRRKPQQEFTHSWMVGALKGHTAPILDMDFSGNGKFLASCAEDRELAPTKEDVERASDAHVDADAAPAEASLKGARSPRNGPGKSQASTPAPSSAPPSPSSSTKSSSSAASGSEQQRAILSRRQRKNRTRAPREQRRELRARDASRDDGHKGPPSAPVPVTAAPDSVNAAASGTSATASANSLSNSSNGSFMPPSANGHSLPSSKAITATVVASGSILAAKSANGNVTTATARPQPERAPPEPGPPNQLHRLGDAALAGLLRNYALGGEQLAHLGYPVELGQFPGHAVILSCQQQQYPYEQQQQQQQQQQHHHYQQHQLEQQEQHQQHEQQEQQLEHQQHQQEQEDQSQEQQQEHHHHHHYHHHHHHYHHHHHQPGQRLDANAREFVPGDAGSAGSSLESSDLEQESASDSDKGSEAGERAETAIERRCARCGRPFYVSLEDGEYLREEKCCYHWGKLRDALWECCQARQSSRGCASAKAHVWTGLVPGFNGPFADYAQTRPARQVPRDGNYGVYALDCEMCFTKRGLELGKVTVVALDGRVVYEALVKPDAEVIDYNTRFSGLRPRDLAKASKSLRQVQKDITSFVTTETILIGHGLENDLRALRILHPTVVDTCVAFPHFLGYPFRNSLKTLARTVLRREIQVKEHDSAEDARIAVDLMLTRLQHDFF